MDTPLPPGCTILKFGCDSFVDSIILDAETDEELYRIQTNSPSGIPVGLKGIQTLLVATDGRKPQEIARIIKNVMFKSDTIAFPHRRLAPMKIKDWIHNDAFAEPYVPPTTNFGAFLLILNVITEVPQRQM